MSKSVSKYKNVLLQKTEYSEMFSMFLYSKINHLNFKKIVKRRAANTLNDFPDFIINKKKFLEVTRSLDQLSGIQQKDIAYVFDSKDKKQAVEAKNLKIKQDSFNHRLLFRRKFGFVYAEKELESYDEIKNRIISAIINKSNNKSVIKNEKELDLFIIEYEFLTKDKVKEIFEWFKNSKINSFDSIYLHCLFSENKTCVFKINKKKFKLYKVRSPRKDKIADLLFKLGWLNEIDFIK